jgi:hypothetical protein
MASGIGGLVIGVLLIAIGIDGAFTRAGAARIVCGVLPPAGLALVGFGILRLCVPGFFPF